MRRTYKHKRIISLILSAVLIFGMIPTAFATESAPAETTAETTAPVETTIPVVETTSAAEETTSAAEETTSAAEETTSAAEETTSAAEETTVPETTEDVEETTVPETTVETTVPETTAPEETTVPETTEETEPEEEEDEGPTFIRPVFFDKAATYIETIKESLFSSWGFFGANLLNSDGSGDTDEIEDSEGIFTDKWVEDNGDGTFTLTLESYVEGSSETVNTVKKVPADIVLVLDESGSMDNCIKCGIDQCERKDKYQPIYSNKMDSAKASTYYYKTSEDSEYYNASYCSICKKWYQQTNHHNDDGTHTGKTRPPKASADATDGYQYYTYCEHEERYVSLDNAVNGFLNSINADAAGDDGVLGTKDDVTHRVALVGFGTKAHLRSYVLSANANTGALGTTLKGMSTESNDYVDDQGYWKNGDEEGYIHLTDWLVEKNGTNYVVNSDRSRYLRMLRWANNANDQEKLKTALGYIGRDNGSTYTELGLDAARAIFAFSNAPYTGTQNPTASKDTNGRNRVVVMFTDGAPTHGSDYFSNANTAISYAKDLKNDFDAAVYTVGIFSGANASNPANLPTNHDYSSGNLYPDSTNANRSAKGIDLANRFMHLVSSNYPNATAMETTGSLNNNLNGGSYYLSAGDSNELSQVFQRIYESITGDAEVSAELTEKSTVKDIVMSSFEIPEGAKSVSAYSVAYKGDDANGKAQWDTIKVSEYTPEVSGNTVTVTGFNFKEKYVGIDYTKDEAGNILAEDPHGEKLVLKIVIKPDEDFDGGSHVATNTDQAGIYYENGAKAASFPLPHVDIGTNVTVTKQVVGANAEKTKEFKFDVRYNELTGYQNIKSDLIETDVENSNYLKAIPTQREPKEELHHNETATYSKVLIGVDQYVLVKEEADPAYTTTITAKDSKGKITNITTEDGYWKIPVNNPNVEITVTNTIKSADLTIVKKVAKLADLKKDPDTTFLFHLKGTDNGTNTVDMILAINDNSTTTTVGQLDIKSLPVGNYTLTELEDWSWRYEVSKIESTKVTNVTTASVDSDDKHEQIKFTLTYEGGTITFTNDREQDKWLDGDTYCENTFNKK